MAESSGNDWRALARMAGEPFDQKGWEAYDRERTTALNSAEGKV